MITYHFPTFQMHYNTDTGMVTTIYPDSCYSSVEVNTDHEFHSQYLHITPAQVNLQHELSHHIVAMAFGQQTCAIIYNSAHGVAMPPHAQHLEWLITSLSYFSLGVPFRPDHAHEWKALYEIAQVKDPYLLKKELYSLLLGYSTKNVQVKYI